MTAHPFSLSAPGVVILQPGAAGTFTVTNVGTETLLVHQALGRYSVKALQYPAASHATPATMSGPWITVAPGSFTLAPGHSEAVRISDHVPAGVQGDHYMSVVWTATLAGHATGNLHLAGAVATSVEIPMPGTATAVTASGLAQAPAAPPAPGGIGAGLLAVLAFAVLAVLVVVIAVRRRVRRA